jgi:hypothetical protein
MIFFVRFGIVMFLTMTLSTLFSLLPFAAALMVIGPLGTDGMLSNIYGPILRKAHAKLEHEHKRALAHLPTKQKQTLPPISLEDENTASL